MGDAGLGSATWLDPDALPRLASEVARCPIVVMTTRKNDSSLMMKEWLLQGGSRDVTGLFTTHVATPDPGAREVRVRVRANSLKARDRLCCGARTNRVPSRSRAALRRRW